jgi:hypothetical protein
VDISQSVGQLQDKGTAARGGGISHLEHADTGLETRNNGLSEKLDLGIRPYRGWAVVLFLPSFVLHGRLCGDGGMARQDQHKHSS